MLVAGGLAAYANSLDAPFVFDDHGSIIDNPYIRHLWPLKSALSAPVQSAMAGRPVVSLSLALNYAWNVGLSPAGFRAWNLAVHLLAGLVLFGVVRRTLTSPVLAVRFGAAAYWLAFICALFWLVHPLNTEVVDYVTQRTESTMGLFYLLTLYAAIRAISAEGGAVWRWRGAAIAACAFGMASKESMVTAPVMVLVCDAVFWSGGIGRATRARWPLYAGLAATWLILVWLNAAGPRSNSAGLSSGLTPWTYLLNQPAMLVHYLKLTFWPHGLVIDYGEPRAMTLRDALPAALVIVALLAATAAAWRKQRALAFLGLWFFVTLAPSSSIIPIATEVGAERRMYLPLIAIVVLLVVGGERLLSGRLQFVDSRRRNRLMAAGVAAIYCALTALTLQRNAEYHSRTGIWETVLERRPHGRAHYNLALELREEGHRAEAIRHYQLALKDEPTAHYALGFELAADGRRQEAISHFRDYIRLRPDDANVIRAYVLLGHALKDDGQFEPAAAALREALARHPGNADARSELADVFASQQRFVEAVREYREYLRLAPKSAAGHNNLGIALVELDREVEAVEEFALAVELEPEDPAKRRNLGNALASLGRLEEATTEYRRGLALDPTDIGMHNALGMVLAARGQVEEALAEFRLSISLDPANEDTQRDFAEAFPRLPSIDGDRPSRQR